MKLRNLRDRLFREGATALSLIGFPGDEYACPLCLRIFRADALNARALTIDHVPPRALGGRLAVLTCQQCNNESGHELDAHAANRSRMEALMGAVLGKGRPESGPARLRVGDAAVNINLGAGGETNELTILPGSNDPGEVERLFQNTTRLRDGDEIHIDLGVSFHVNRAKVADLRAAYLAVFAEFGFAWIGHASYARVRAQIQQPEEEVLESFWLAPREIGINETTIIWAEAPFPCLLVLLSGRGVVLPRLGAPLPFPLLSEARRAGAPSSVKGKRLGWPKRTEFRYDQYVAKRRNA